MRGKRGYDADAGSEKYGGRVNKCVTTLIVRKTADRMSLYDIINIKKKRVRRLGRRPYGRKPLPLFIIA